MTPPAMCMRLRRSQIVETARLPSIGMINRMKAIGPTQRNSCRRKVLRRSHLLCTYEQSTAAHGGQHQVGPQGNGQLAGLRRSPLARAHELDLGSSDLQRPRLVKLTDDLQLLLQHIDNVVAQPADISQSSALSVERAMGASHGTTGLACKAAE